MEILVIRHAESIYNIHKPNITFMDTWLSKLGEKQAQECANYLYEAFPDIKDWKGFTSPFLRTLQTSQIINNTCGTCFDVDFRLREHIVATAGFKMLPFTLLNRSQNFTFPVFNFDQKHDYLIDEFDTPNNILARLGSFLNELRSDGRYLIVSHGTPCHTLTYMLDGTMHVPEWNGVMLNTSVSYYRDGKWQYIAKFINSGVDPRIAKAGGANVKLT